MTATQAEQALLAAGVNAWDAYDMLADRGYEPGGFDDGRELGMIRLLEIWTEWEDANRVNVLGLTLLN